MPVRMPCRHSIWVQAARCAVLSSLFLYAGCQTPNFQSAEQQRTYTYYGAEDGRAPIESMESDDIDPLQSEEGDDVDEEEDLADEVASHPFADNPLLCKDSVYYAAWENQFDQTWSKKSANRSLKNSSLVRDRTDEYIRLVYPGIEKTGYDFPLEMNAQVLNWVDYFTGTGRKHFAVWLRRGQQYIPEMEKILEKRGLPKDLVYLAMIESGYSTRAASHAGAVGIWQFMPATGREYNLLVNSYVDERRNPEKSAEAAAAYLSALYSMFGNWHVAAASYNCGPGCMQRTLRTHGTESSYFELTSKGVVNPETANYVPKMIAAMLVGKNATAFGFESKQNVSQKLPTKTITVSRPIALKDMATALNVHHKTLETLNPELRQGMTPPSRFARNGVYNLNIPAEKHGHALVALEGLKTVLEPTKKVSRSKVKSSQKSDIASVKSSKKTVASQAKVRLSSSKVQGVRLASSSKVTTQKSTAKTNAKTTSVAKQATKQETVKSFAVRHKVKVSDLVKLNKGFTRTTTVKKGQTVYIPKKV